LKKRKEEKKHHGMNGTCVTLLCNPSKKNGEKKKSDLCFNPRNLILVIRTQFDTWD
jgi:hypothetical protein